MVDYKKALALLFLVVLGSYFFIYNLGAQSIRETDESTHIRVIQQMTRSGEYFSPKLDETDYVNKPPFKMWLTIGVTKVFGESNFTFRIIDGLSGIGVVLLTVAAGQIFLGSFWAGFWAGLILLLSPGFVLQLRYIEATQDALVNFLFMLAVVVGATTATRANKTLSAVLFGIIIGCGILTKLVAILPAGFIVLAYLYATGFPKKDLFKFTALSAVAAAVVTLFFYIPRIIQIPDLLTKMFAVEIDGRLFEGYFNKNDVWLYYKHLFVDEKLTCNTLLIPALILGTVLSVFRWNDPKYTGLRVVLTWALGLLGMYTYFKSRVPYYMAPAYPAFALLCGYFLYRVFTLLSLKNRFRSAVLVVALVYMSIPIYQKTGRLLAIKQKGGKKIPFEVELQKVQNAYSDNPNLRFFSYQIEPFLLNSGNNAWRHKSYIDMAHPVREVLASPEAVSSITGDFFVLTPAQNAAEVIAVSKPCQETEVKVVSPQFKKKGRLTPDLFTLLRYGQC